MARKIEFKEREIETMPEGAMLEKQICDEEVKFLTFQAQLLKAQEAKKKAEEAEALEAYGAKGGDPSAQDRLEKAEQSFQRACADARHYTAALRTCEQKLIELKARLAQAERHAKEKELAQQAQELMRNIEEFDRSLVAFTIPLAELIRQSFEMSKLSEELGLHRNFPIKVRQVVANVLFDRLGTFNFPEMPRPQSVFRNKAASELLGRLLGQFAGEHKGEEVSA